MTSLQIGLKLESKLYPGFNRTHKECTEAEVPIRDKRPLQQRFTAFIWLGFHHNAQIWWNGRFSEESTHSLGLLADRKANI
jgi:hypothetical protein